MLKIRLQRVGRKQEPSFRLVLTDSKNSTKSGRFKEVLGSYDPRKTTEVLKADRIRHWLSQGAGLTGTVNNLLIKKGVIRGKKIHVGTDYKAPASAEPATETPVENPEVLASNEEAAPAEPPASEEATAPESQQSA